MVFVGSISIMCMECLKWVHKRCSGISGKLKVMLISTAGDVW